MSPTHHKPVDLITGASSGFGMLTSLRFAEKGYRVIATMRNLDQKEQLMQRAQEVRTDGNITCWTFDVTDEHKIESIIMNIEKQFGKLDILVNNAGFATG